MNKAYSRQEYGTSINAVLPTSRRIIRLYGFFGTPRISPRRAARNRLSPQLDTAGFRIIGR
jgi:hypothetical protein